MKKYVVLLSLLNIFFNIQAQFKVIYPCNGCSSGNIYSAYFKNDTVGYFGTYHCIAQTKDGAATLSNVGYGINTSSDFSWPNADTGFIANGSKISYTYDGGNTWDVNYHGQMGIANDIHAFSGTHYMIVATDGGIFETFDGGNNFVQPSSGTTYNLNAVHFITNKLGFICGDNGLVLKTTNGGVTWTKSSLGVSSDLKYVWFVDNTTGYICGDDGYIFKTGNSGSKWSVLKSNVTTLLTCIQSTGSNKNILYACGGQGVILKSIDSGANWKNVSIAGIKNTYNKLFFIDSLTGYCVGDSFLFLKTTSCPQASFTTDTNQICAGTIIKFNNTSDGPANTYHWYLDGQFLTSQTDTSYQFKNAGTFELKLVAESSIESCPDTATQSIIIYDYPSKPTINGNRLLCPNNTINLSCDSNYAYQWLDSNNNPILNANGKNFQATHSGVYRVMVNNVYNCSIISDTFSILNMPGKPQASFTKTVDTSQTISLVNTSVLHDSSHWSISDVNTQQNFNLFSVFNTPTPFKPSGGDGIYTIRLKTYNYCGIDSFSDTVLIQTPKDSTVDTTKNTINDLQNYFHWSIYPNPIVDHVYINLNQSSVLYVKLYQLNGDEMISHKITEPQSNIDLRFLNAGIYLLELTDGKYIKTERIVVVR